jgi:exopolysaccharide biosynthesis polyprenyl glycosylphosphotransferase
VELAQRISRRTRTGARRGAGATTATVTPTASLLDDRRPNGRAVEDRVPGDAEDDPAPWSQLAQNRLPVVVSTGPPTPTAATPLAGTRRLLKPALVGADTLAVAVALAAAALLYGAGDRTGGAGPVLTVSLATLPLWPVLFAQQALYRSARVQRRADELRGVVQSAVAGGLLLTAAAALAGLRPAPSWTLLSVAAVLVAVTVEREVVRQVLGRWRRRSELLRPVAVAGSRSEVRRVADQLRRSPAGYAVVGLVEIPDASDETARAVGPDGVRELVAASRATGVVLSPAGLAPEVTNRLIRELTRDGLWVEVAAPLAEVAACRVEVGTGGPCSTLTVAPAPAHGWRRVAKRCFDVVVAGAALLLALPVLALAALAVRIGSGPGVVFRQERVGYRGRTFTLLKLRTMVPDAEARLEALRDLNEAAEPMFKMTRDPRVTPIGRWLRSTSIDELPQLWNVVRGDMSLVGPRPALPTEVRAWNDVLRERLRVRPGITGAWQVSGRFTVGLDDYCRLDLDYVDNWSISGDVGLLLRTVPVVLGRRGAA